MIAQTSAKISAEDMNPPFVDINSIQRRKNGPAPEPLSKYLPRSENLEAASCRRVRAAATPAKLARDFNRLPAGKPDCAQSLNSGSFAGTAVFLSVTDWGMAVLKGG